MGVVYLARASRRWVAVKTMRAADLGDPAARARFRAEAGYARRIRCRHTAEVITDGSGEALPYLVIEYVAGPPLSSVVERGGPLTPGALHAVALGLADALAEIHQAGVVHRDVTPANVLLSDAGPRVIDFGIAHGTGRPLG